VILLAMLCAASAWLVTRKAPQHRPIALALTVCAGLDVFRWATDLPPRADLALCLGGPAISAWAYVRVMRAPYAGTRGHLVLTCGLLIMALNGRWEWILPSAYLGTVASAVGGYIDARELETWPGWTVTQRTALGLLVGDVAGIATLCGREWVHWQAGVTLGLVALYQLWWYWRWNRE
jgi:hypothetical protein